MTLTLFFAWESGKDLALANRLAPRPRRFAAYGALKSAGFVARGPSMGIK